MYIVESYMCDYVHLTLTADGKGPVLLPLETVC